MQIISKSTINYYVVCVCVCYIKGNYDMFGFVFFAIYYQCIFIDI